jgi:hypothetical protein
LTHTDPAISWRRFGWATLVTAGLAVVWGCGGRPGSRAATPTGPTAPRVLPLARVFLVETGGPPPPDTSVTFTTGSPRSIVLYHSGESIVFARIRFDAAAFGDSGRAVQVEVKPRPGIYGFELTTSLPFRAAHGHVTFVYGRYFAAPARARQVYRSDVAFERVLSVGRLLTDGQVELLPSTHPAADHLSADLPEAGAYIMAAPQ